MATSFVSSVGLPGCTVNPTVISSPAPDQGTTSDGNTGIGVGCFIIVFAAVSPGVLLLWLRYRERRRAIARDQESKIENRKRSEPYLQQKAELEAEQKRHELEAKQRAYETTWQQAEMEAEQIRREMEAEDVRHEMPALYPKHELEGEGHFKDLEAPQQLQDTHAKSPNIRRKPLNQKAERAGLSRGR